MQVDWRSYWNRCKEVSLRVWEKVKTWSVATWGKVSSWCVAQWSRFETWYMAQQEVVKKRSEVSHERITIKRAVLAFMETWGLGSRNIFYTMWHLIYGQ